MKFSDDFIYQLASRWAPINYQYINLRDWKNHYYTKQDIVVPVNMEYYKCGEEDKEVSYNTRNMRDSLKQVEIKSVTPVAYYSFAATKNHFYLLYSFYHADDTTHPNDMEGCLVILERNNSKQKLLGMVTIAHGKKPKYAFNENLLLNDGSQSKPSRMFVEDEGQNKHPIIQQESGKHGLYGLGYPWKLTQIWRWFKNIFGFRSDIIVYYPNGSVKPYDVSDLTRYKNTTHYATFYYELIDILKDSDDEQGRGFYHRRIRENSEGIENSTFNQNGRFHGNAVNPPWLWEYDGISLWDDPAFLAEKWFVPNKGCKSFRDEQGSKKINYEHKMNGEEPPIVVKKDNGSTENISEFNREGKWFKDSKGRFLLFRGVNIASRTKLPPYLPTLPLDVRHLDSEGIKKFHLELKDLQPEFDQLKKLGINIVRFLVIWKAIEPEPSPNPEILSKDGRIYLELVKVIIDNLYSRGICVIIDFHQDLAHETFDGDGFPDWVINPDRLSNDPTPPDNPQWQFEYFKNPGVRETMNKFWQNSEIKYKGSAYKPQEHLAKTIGATARFFQSINHGKGHAGILGYELFNEPIALDPDFVTFEKEYMYNYYEKTRQEIRKKIGTEKGDTTAFLFMEPRSNLSAHIDMEYDFGALDEIINLEWHLDLSQIADERVVFSFHYYDFMMFLLPFILDVNKKERKYKKLFKELKRKALESGGIPFLTEFGASNDWQTSLFPDMESYDTVVRATIELHYQAIEDNLLNSTYWNYDFYWTEDKKDNWNGENFSLLDSNRHGKNLDFISRPYPMCSSSEPIYLKFDQNNKYCIMKFKGFTVDAPTNIYIPKSRHYENGFQVFATSDVMKWDKENQLLVWEPNKEHDEHLLVICPLDQFDKTVLSNESTEIRKELKKALSISD